RIFSRNLSRATASASSACARAMSMSPLRSASASSASRLAFSTAASSTSRARSAVSASTVTTLGCTSSTPPETKKLCSSPLSVCTRISPLASRVISGEWRGAMPISPSSAGTNTIAAGPEKIAPSALTMSTWIVAIPEPLGATLQRLRLFHRLFDRADHVERLLRQVVVLAVDDRLEALDGVLQRHVLAGRAGEHFRDAERLRQEALDLARARHDQLVFLGQFVHAENGDDVLQLLVALQGALHAAGNVVVLAAHDQRIELARGGVERVHGGIDAKRGDVTRQHDGRVKVREGGRRGRVGQVVRGHVHGLHGSDRALLGRGDAFLQDAHFLGQGRLVTHRG